MDDQNLKEAIGKLKGSSKRNFKQSVDLIVNLRNLDLKNPDHQVEFYLQLPKPKGKKTKVCALVGPELSDNAKKVMDVVILQQEFEKYSKNKSLIKRLAEDCDFFVAQATIMPKIATAFGKVLGPRGKMPSPKAGCIVPPNANLDPLYKSLQKTVRISGKKAPLVQTIVGKEEASLDDLFENSKFIISNLVHHLPQGENNIKSIFIKYTMGSPIKVM